MSKNTENESFPELEELRTSKMVRLLVIAVAIGYPAAFIPLYWSALGPHESTTPEPVSALLLQGQTANEAAAAFGGYLTVLLGAVALAAGVTSLLGRRARRRTERRLQAIMSGTD